MLRVVECNDICALTFSAKNVQFHVVKFQDADCQRARSVRGDFVMRAGPIFHNPVHGFERSHTYLRIVKNGKQYLMTAVST